MTSKYFAFIDLETGGLNKVKKSPEHPLIPEWKYGFNHYAILEFALIITDSSLNEIYEPIHFVIKHDQETLDSKVGAWSKNEFKDTLMKDSWLKSQQTQLALAVPIHGSSYRCNTF